jgi:hypothetical protein
MRESVARRKTRESVARLQNQRARKGGSRIVNHQTALRRTNLPSRLRRSRGRRGIYPLPKEMISTLKKASSSQRSMRRLSSSR